MSDMSFSVIFSESEHTFSVGLRSLFSSTYTGAYTVTPSVSSQALPTANRLLDQNVVVEAMPAGALLSSMSMQVPSADIDIGYTSSGKVIAYLNTSASLAPVGSSGYLGTSEQTFLKAVGSNAFSLPTFSGATIVPSTSSQVAVPSKKFTTGPVIVDAVPPASLISEASISANLSMSVNSSGFVTAALADAVNLHPVASDGWVGSSASLSLAVQMSGSLQLAIQSASTITPTESAQVAVESGKWTTGSVIVDAMPVGGFLPSVEMSLGSMQLQYTPSGKIYIDINVTDTVTPMSKSGYMSQGESLNVHVSASPHGYLPSVSGSTFIPSTTSQVLASAYRWTTGSIIMDAIPSSYIIPSGTSTLTSDGTYDIASYASVLVSIGSDGNNLQYGISDGTIPKVGIAKVGSAKVV